MAADEEKIRARAHELWVDEGRPEGRHKAHWEQARRELDASDFSLEPEPGLPEQFAANDGDHGIPKRSTADQSAASDATQVGVTHRR